MSSEGKKKRGEAGQSNAKNIAFRYGGHHCDYSTAIRSSHSPYAAGSKALQAIQLGDMLNNLGHVATVSDNFAHKMENASRRCTHPSLVF